MKRAGYYCGKLLSRQKDTEFSGDDYGKIKKVVSIWICFDSRENLKNTVSRFSLAKEDLFGHPVFEKKNYDVIEIIVVCLGDEDKERNELLKYVETMFSDTLSRDEKRRILEGEFGMVYDDVEEVLEMCDYSDYLIEKGVTKATLDALESVMRKLGLSITEAMDVLNVPQADREMYQKKLEARKPAMA